MVQWQKTAEFIEYPAALAAMETHVDALFEGRVGEKVWLLEHPPLYTAGTSAAEGELLSPQGFPVHKTGRGGRYTYHGPGQRIAYVMLDLRVRGRDVRRYVSQLEDWVIAALSVFDVQAERREGRIGLWVVTPQGHEEKIAAIGVRIRRWVTYHGVSINVDPNLSHFNGIIPCGLSSFGVTSLKALGKDVHMEELDAALQEKWPQVFGP